MYSYLKMNLEELKKIENQIEILKEILHQKEIELRDLRENMGIKACRYCGADISKQKGGDYCYICWNNG